MNRILLFNLMLILPKFSHAWREGNGNFGVFPRFRSSVTSVNLGNGDSRVNLPSNHFFSNSCVVARLSYEGFAGSNIYKLKALMEKRGYRFRVKSKKYYQKMRDAELEGKSVNYSEFAFKNAGYSKRVGLHVLLGANFEQSELKEDYPFKVVRVSHFSNPFDPYYLKSKRIGAWWIPFHGKIKGLKFDHENEEHLEILRKSYLWSVKFMPYCFEY